ncbi:hypothetical protein D1007_26617 [Hordeum vulgare]|nr:hypothetical protein D1007_26617 [Hordeum vulgare]
MLDGEHAIYGQSYKPVYSTSNKQIGAVSTAEFHPQFMSDGDHENFLKEIKSSDLMANNPGDIVDDMVVSPMRMSTHPGVISMSSHMDYSSKQLKFFDMAEFDEECMDKPPKMQCLPDEMIKIFSSTKRSLLDTLEQTESEKKGKFQEESSKWGLVLSIRPTTRGHGDISIMVKAKEYQKKKNLEIPKTFKGNSFSCLDKNVLAAYAKKVDVCLASSPTLMDPKKAKGMSTTVPSSSKLPLQVVTSEFDRGDRHAHRAGERNHNTTRSSASHNTTRRRACSDRGQHWSGSNYGNDGGNRASTAPLTI